MLTNNDQVEMLSNCSSVGFISRGSAVGHELVSDAQYQDGNLPSFFTAALKDEGIEGCKTENIFSYSVSGSDFRSDIGTLCGSTEDIKCEAESFPQNIHTGGAVSLGLDSSNFPCQSQKGGSSHFNPSSCRTTLPDVTCFTSELRSIYQDGASIGFTSNSSPGSDSGYASEHCIGQNCRIQSPLMPRKPVRVSETKAESLAPKTDRGSIKLVIPQNVLNTMQSISSADAGQRLCTNSNVKYLVPVNIEKYAADSNAHHSQQMSMGKGPPPTKGNQASSVPRPVLVVPRTDLMQMSTTNDAQPACHIIKLINATLDATMCSTTSGRTGQDLLHQDSGTRSSSNDSTTKEFVLPSGKRTAENAAKNRFVCEGCGKVFALNRIILRTGGLSLQGKPQYCINCFETYQATF